MFSHGMFNTYNPLKMAVIVQQVRMYEFFLNQAVINKIGLQFQLSRTEVVSKVPTHFYQ